MPTQICEITAEWLDDEHVILHHQTGVKTGILTQLEAIEHAYQYYVAEFLAAGDDWHQADEMAGDWTYDLLID